MKKKCPCKIKEPKGGSIYGSDPNTYTPKGGSLLGSNPNTYTPKNLPQPNLLGSDTNTFTPKNLPQGGSIKTKKPKQKRKPSAWIEHVKKIRAKMPKGSSYKDALKIASKSWKK